MKFKDFSRVKDSLGFEYVKNSIMVGKNLKPCIYCGEPTEYIDVYSEGHVCSEECVDEWYERFMKF